ncbi:hypothetical protein [Gottfriedia acidiceleris]|uniref:hypothetical protein n=1 Tax=Gottfriedia acidiceleris TaxID=371036 RepID=UPI001F3620BF|nr:hypothetical protein [Gottfriedia acidiceleris]
MYNKILINQFEKGKAFIKMNGRKLESARFDFEFENGDKESVLNELKKYQNEDGGFGKAIEPDFLLPNSSPMGTWVAGQILMEIDLDADHQMVKQMIEYLVQTNDRESGMWDSVLEDTNDYPHAPWWHWTEGVQENWMFNPGVELAAFLVHWSTVKSGSAEIGWHSIENAVKHLMQKNEMDRHEINNYQQFIKIIEPYKELLELRTQRSLESISTKILDLAEKCIAKDVSNWGTGYKPLPLDFIDHPSHPLSERFGHLIEKNLDFYVQQINKDGVWDISWSWGSYPKHFEIARQQWMGVLAANRYKQFKAFGYL